MNSWQFQLLQNLLNNWLGAAEPDYHPPEEEAAALGWFLYLSNQGEAERFEFLKQAMAIGAGPEFLIQLRYLGEIRQLES